MLMPEPGSGFPGRCTSIHPATGRSLPAEQCGQRVVADVPEDLARVNLFLQVERWALLCPPSDCAWDTVCLPGHKSGQSLENVKQQMCMLRTHSHF